MRLSHYSAHHMQEEPRTSKQARTPFLLVIDIQISDPNHFPCFFSFEGYSNGYSRWLYSKDSIRNLDSSEHQRIWFQEATEFASTNLKPADLSKQPLFASIVRKLQVILYKGLCLLPPDDLQVCNHFIFPPRLSFNANRGWRESFIFHMLDTDRDTAKICSCLSS